MLVRDVAAMLGAIWEGDGDRRIHRVAPLETAGPKDITFAASLRTAKVAADGSAGCTIVPIQYSNPRSQTIIRVQNPRAAIAQVIARLHPKRNPARRIHPAAIVAPGADIGDSVAIGAYATIGEGTRIANGTTIGAGTSIGDDVTIGENCTIHANVTIYPEVVIGRRVVIHSGAVLGADGFGFVLSEGHWENFPQIGRVEIGDDVEIGANSCVDRAALGVTRIGNGTKLDNMVHIGHNCSIGHDVVIAAQTGLAGGVVVEDFVVIGGQVGIGDKARIESRAVLGSGCGILTSKIVRQGQTVWGTPARPLKMYLEQLALVARLPEMRAQLREIEKKVKELEAAG